MAAAIVYVFASIAGFTIGVVLTFVVLFALAHLEDDKTAGGAYVALAMMISPIIGVLGSCISFAITSKVLN